MAVIKSMSIIGFGHYVEKQEYAHLFDKVTAASIIIIYAIAMMLYLIHRRARFLFVCYRWRSPYYSSFVKIKGVVTQTEKSEPSAKNSAFGSLFLFLGFVTAPLISNQCKIKMRRSP